MSDREDVRSEFLELLYQLDAEDLAWAAKTFKAYREWHKSNEPARREATADSDVWRRTF